MTEHALLTTDEAFSQQNYYDKKKSLQLFR